MKKILFNGISVSRNEIYGVQRNTLELLKELDKIIEPGIAYLAVPSTSERSFNFNNIGLVYTEIDNESAFEVLRWNLWGFGRFAKKRNLLTADMTLGLPLTHCDLVSVYDCISEMFKENSNTLSQKIKRTFYMIRVKWNLRNADVVTTDSYSAKSDLLRIYKCNPDKINVIYCGWQHFQKVLPEESIIDKLGISNKIFFFSLGSRYYHKNTKWIVEAAKQNPQYVFVVSGSKNLSSSDKYTTTSAIDNLIFTGYLSDGEIKMLMSKCKAFIQPSLYEGFGIPPMEAMSTGASCIVSNVSSLPEVYGESVWYINPRDYSNIDIDQIMSKGKKNNNVVLEKYSWKKSAEQLKCLIMNLCEE